MLMEEEMLLCVTGTPVMYKLSELMEPSVVFYLQHRTVSVAYRQLDNTLILGYESNNLLEGRLVGGMSRN